MGIADGDVSEVSAIEGALAESAVVLAPAVGASQNERQVRLAPPK